MKNESSLRYRGNMSQALRSQKHTEELTRGYSWKWKNSIARNSWVELRARKIFARNSLDPNSQMSRCLRCMTKGKIYNFEILKAFRKHFYQAARTIDDNIPKGANTVTYFPIGGVGTSPTVPKLYSAIAWLPNHEGNSASRSRNFLELVQTPGCSIYPLAFVAS